MNTIEEMKKIQRNIDQKKSAKDRLEGKLSGMMDSLKELGYSSVYAAEKDLIKIEKEILKMEEACDKSIQDFKEKYSDFLRG